MTEVIENAEQKSIQQMVQEEVKAYMDAMFRNPVMLDTLASALLSRAVAALNYRAQHSTQRMPTLVVSENPIPSAIRVILDEQGAMVAEEQLANQEGKVPTDAQWERSGSIMDSVEVYDAVKELVLSYGAVPNKHYYVLDDITLEKHRNSLNEKIRQSVDLAAVEQELSDE